MNIEKTMCDRLGYKYKYVFENVLFVIHHLPYAKEYINEETLKLLEELNLKIQTGDIEIIEFTRPLYKCLDVDEIIKEKDKEIERLNNIINGLEKDLRTLWNVCWNNDTEMTSYQNEIFDKYYDKFHKKN